MKKIFLLLTLLIHNLTTYSTDTASDDMQTEIFSKILAFAIPSLKYNNANSSSLFFGFRGKNYNGGFFESHYHLDHESVDKILEDILDYSEQTNPYDAKITNIVRSFLSSSDPETRYMGLYLATTGAKPELLKQLVLSVIDDPNYQVTGQIMWSFIKLIPENMLVDTAYRYMIQQAVSDSISNNLMALELLWTLHPYYWKEILPIFTNINHPLLQIELLLMKNRFCYEDINEDAIKQLCRQVLTSVDEDIRYSGLYVLLKLKDLYVFDDFIGQCIENAMTDTPRIQMQALWVLSQMLDRYVDIDNITEIAQNALAHPDWHVRFGGALLMQKIISSTSSDNFDQYYNDESELAILCQSDENIFMQFLGMTLYA